MSWLVHYYFLLVLPFILITLIRSPAATAFTSHPTNQSANTIHQRTGQSMMMTSNAANNANGEAYTKPPSISISDAFDGGNIQMMKQTRSDNTNDNEHHTITVELHIKKDPFSELEQKHHFQYFAFRAAVSHLSSKEQQKQKLTVNFVITNAGDVSYPQAWEGSTVCYSPNLEEDADRGDWQRKLSTSYNKDAKTLQWTHTFDSNDDVSSSSSSSMYFAYFAPFSYQRHLNLVAKCAKSPLAIVSTLGGQTLDGREMDLITVGTGKLTAWIIHRQHPGESQAEYYAEGLLTRLLGLDHQHGEIDGNVRSLLQQYTIHIVPNMCPDGALRGHLRTNACGANLNREWATVDPNYEAPTLERSPEVYHVLARMDESPPDLFLDIHGDEELPVNFLAGAQGTPHWGTRMEKLHGAFLAAYSRSNSDMQQTIGYTPMEPGTAVVNTATKVIATRFQCLASTLEMPFKDCATNPDPVRGWSPNRCRMLGASVVEPLLYIRPYLKAEGEFWKDFPAVDAYIKPSHREFTYGKNNEVLDL